MIYHILIAFAVSFYGTNAFYQIDGPIDSEDTLEIVHVLFRHGQRTPDISTIYPKDPYKNETYFPYGVGALTNDGKRTQYNLGRELRLKYDQFLGKLYTPQILDVQASPISRTRISAQLVLASLFQPSSVEVWNAHLNWQPIDFVSPQMDEDLLFLYLRNCQRFVESVKERNAQVLSTGQVGESDKIEKLFQYLTHYSGWNVSSLEEIFLLQNGLSAEEEFGLKLPKWTKYVYPEPLKSLGKLYWQYSTDTDVLKTLSGGFLLRRIIEDTQNKIDGIESHKSRKMVLYSGHDYTIVALQSVLGIYKPHHPPYGAYVAVEVHRMMRGHGIKVLYQDYSKKHPQILQLPGCEDLCPFEEFMNLYSKFLPTPDMCKLS